MGQYYKPIILSGIKYKKNHSNKGKVITSLISYNYGNGAKLIEHSYIGNSFVGAVEHLINRENGLYSGDNGFRLVWGGDYADEESHKFQGEKVNLYELAKHSKDKIAVENKHYRYIINESTKEYVDTTKSSKVDEWGWQIHPLPLLVAEGNGRGGGDYCGKNQKMVGIWARHRISVSDSIPEGFKEFKVFFDN